MTSEVLEMALKYAEIGIPVMPLHGIKEDGSCTCKKGNSCSSKGKHPIFSGWQELATTDQEVIKKWWSQYPHANIGIPTGEKSGWLVLDIDTKYQGDESLEVLEMLYDDLPPTVTAITGSGGRHLIFKYPRDLHIPNKVSFKQGLDTRSDGGLIVATPSLHVSGNTYSWLEGYSPFDREPAGAPAWLLELMQEEKKQKLIGAFDSTIGEGSRNTYLTSFAGSLRRKGMEEAELLEALIKQNEEKCNPPLPFTELKSIANSICKYPPQPNSLIPYKFNDIGNAQRLVALYGEDIHYCPEWNSWFYYTGYWEKDLRGEIYAKARETIAKLDQEAHEKGEEKVIAFATRSGFHSRIEAMLNQAKTLVEYNIPVVAKEWDAQDDLICLKNVTIDFKLKDKDSGFEVREHRREDYITKQLDFEYTPQAMCPRWEKFLIDIIPDEATRLFLQRAIGYTLTGSTCEDMLFILHGSGSNGKSTFIQTISEMLGSYAKTIQPETIMQREKSGALNTEIASICGARLVKTAEIDEGKRLSESLVKQLTGGDTISTRHLFGKDFEYDPTYKLWISTNHKPKIYGDDHGIWRRICLIPFEVTIKEEDTELDKKLREELPGIFNWALQGLLQWKKIGLKPPSKVCQATEAYRYQEDLVQGFMEDCLTPVQSSKVSATELYKYYEWYCEQNGITKLSSTRFGVKMREDKGLEKKQVCGRVYYMGIAIKEVIVKSMKAEQVEELQLT